MHHSKKLYILIIAVSILTFKAFSIGAGVQVGGIPNLSLTASTEKMDNFDCNITGTVRLFRIPAVFGFGLEAGSDNRQIVYGVSGFADYIFLDHQLVNTWNVYSGAGVSGKFLLSRNSAKTLSVGPRFFTGMNWLFLDNYVEYYAQIAVVPTYNKVISTKGDFFRINFPIETGVRLHF